jgi:hypothetical protein
VNRALLFGVNDRAVSVNRASVDGEHNVVLGECPSRNRASSTCLHCLDRVVDLSACVHLSVGDA